MKLKFYIGFFLCMSQRKISSPIEKVKYISEKIINILDLIVQGNFHKESINLYNTNFEKEVMKNIVKTNGPDEGFVDSYNKALKNSSGIQSFVQIFLTTVFDAIKDIIMDEKTYREKKQKVFTVRIPKNYRNPMKKKN